MKALKLPDLRRLNDLFVYNEKEGKLLRRDGSVSGSLAGRDGYGHVTVDGRKLQVHRVMWKLATGTEPEEIDHINRNKLDNRLCNLRSATKSENQFNAKLRRDSSSGVKGVSFLKRERKWRVLITAHGKRHEKLFTDFERACDYAKELRQNLHSTFAAF